VLALGGIVSGIVTALGLTTTLRIADFLLACLDSLVLVYVISVAWHRSSKRWPRRIDMVALAISVLIPALAWFDIVDPREDRWPRTWTGVGDAIGLLVLLVWANVSVGGLPRPSWRLFKKLSLPFAKMAAVAGLVCLFTVSLPLQFAVTAVIVSSPTGHGHEGTGTGKRVAGNGAKGTSGTGRLKGPTGTRGPTGTGGTGGGAGDSTGCGDSLPPGANSANPDLHVFFYRLIEADNGPGEDVAGCPEGIVHHLRRFPGVEYEYGIDSAGDRASISIVSRTTRAIFLPPAIGVAEELMNRFGAITTSGAQCAGNGGWVLIYDLQGTVALVRTSLGDDTPFVRLDPPALYAWIASMMGHGSRWSWPVRTSSGLPGIVKFKLVHDPVTEDQVDAIYYDTGAKRAFRIVGGQTIYYYNKLGTKISPSFLEGLSPHNRNCIGLLLKSDFPKVK
jgi:hypothetical protein